MKYLLTFESMKPTKFVKIVPIAKNDKVYYRKQNVGSFKNWTNQQFLYLETVFADKLEEYKEWLLSIWKLNYYNDASIYVSKDLDIFRLYPIEEAYRIKLIKQFYNFNERKDFLKKGIKVKSQYLDKIWLNKEEPRNKYSKGASLNTPINLKENPFQKFILKANNPPKDIETAHVIAKSPIGDEIVNRKEKKVFINKFFNAREWDSKVANFNDAMLHINWRNIRGIDLYNIVLGLVIESRIYGQNAAINDNTLITISFNGKEGDRTIGELKKYLKELGNGLVRLSGIKIIENNPWR
jgi:hypothetical protein